MPKGNFKTPHEAVCPGKKRQAVFYLEERRDARSRYEKNRKADKMLTHGSRFNGKRRTEGVLPRVCILDIQMAERESNADTGQPDSPCGSVQGVYRPDRYSKALINAQMAEWLKAPVLKTGDRTRGPGVQIPL